MRKTFATALILLCSLAANALPLVWRADWPDAKPVETLVHRGTDVELQPTWFINKKAADTNGWTFTTFCQTNAVGPWFGPMPGAFFSHTNDVGAAFYNVMVRAQTPGGAVNYTAFARLRMLDSPGFAPGELPLPAKSIDFASVEVFNAPWATPSDVAEATATLAAASNVYTKAETDALISQIPPPDFSTNNTALVETIKATAPAPGNYAVVSNTAVHAAITNALQDTAIAGKADREIVIGQGKGLPGDCFPIAYVYNGDSYSIVNSGGIVVDQLGPLYYRLADSVTGVAVCYFRISDGTYFSNGEASGITFGGTAPTQLAWPVLGDVAKKSSVVYDVDIKTNYYTKAETEAKIVELAPAPGNYAAVSNAAVYAAATNALQDAAISDLSDTTSTLSNSISTLSADKADRSELAGYATPADVYRIVAGTNVVLVVTNYNSTVHAPSMKLQHLDQETGEYVTYWDEARGHGITLTNAMDYADGVAARLDAAKAPRAWSRVTSGLGADAPEGTTFISTPVTHISGGFEFEKKITARGTVWTLCSTSLAAGSTTNGFFEISALDGTPVFSVEKTDSVLVGVNASAIAVVDNACVISVPAVADTHPFARVATTLVNPTWYRESEDGMPAQSPATVSWSGQSGAWVATVDFGSSPHGFVFFEYLQEGGVKIVNSAVVDLSQGVHYGGATYVPTVSGNELKFIRQ